MGTKSERKTGEASGDVISLAQPHGQGPSVRSSVSGGRCAFGLGVEQVQNLQEPPVFWVHIGLEWRKVCAAQPGSEKPWLEALGTRHTAKQESHP